MTSVSEESDSSLSRALPKLQPTLPVRNTLELQCVSDIVYIRADSRLLIKNSENFLVQKTESSLVCLFVVPSFKLLAQHLATGRALHTERCSWQSHSRKNFAIHRQRHTLSLARSHPLPISGKTLAARTTFLSPPSAVRPHGHTQPVHVAATAHSLHPHPSCPPPPRPYGDASTVGLTAAPPAGPTLRRHT